MTWHIGQKTDIPEPLVGVMAEQRRALLRQQTEKLTDFDFIRDWDHREEVMCPKCLAEAIRSEEVAASGEVREAN